MSIRGVIRTGVRLQTRVLRTILRKTPVPLPYWLLVRSASEYARPVADPLFPPVGSLQSTGVSLGVPELRSLLASDVLGMWSLDNATIELLWEWLGGHEPRVIIECGAGNSTLILARFLKRFRDAQGSCVVSVEQGGDDKVEVERRLSQYGMADRVHIFHAPLSPDARYQLDTEQVALQLGDRKADLVLIDGPSGPPGCRLWTLPLLAQFCRPGTMWLLDDAFRDAELSILDIWSRVPGISVDGIYPVGKGLARGVVTDPRSVSFASVAHAVAARNASGWSMRSTAGIRLAV